MSEYSVERTCKECRNVFSFSITKRESAFELWRTPKLWHLNCANCGSTEFYSLGASLADLDQQLLSEWALDESLRVNEQDEEIILAEAKYFDWLLQLLDAPTTLSRKRKIIIEALCVLLYDNTIQDDILEVDTIVADTVRTELIKRRHPVLESRDWIMNYVQEVVFPQLDLPIDLSD